MAASTPSKFLDILKILKAHEVDFVIVGGAAGVLATTIRNATTRDRIILSVRTGSHRGSR